MTTVTIKDIPVTQELPDCAARKIVGGRWSERDETLAGPRLTTQPLATGQQACPTLVDIWRGWCRKWWCVREDNPTPPWERANALGSRSDPTSDHSSAPSRAPLAAPRAPST